jgi:peptidoglycan/LPS O-acetylase OafA/YrhL
MRNASLEGMRGISALLVVLFHLHFAVPGLAWTGNGYLAVDLFFALSGYVIGGAYGKSLKNGPELWAFMVRRFGRLWPALMASNIAAFALLLILAAVGHDANPARLLPRPVEVLSVMTFTQGLNLFDHGIGTDIGWSAGDEFWVYAVFAVACLTLRGHRRAVAFAALAVTGYAVAVWASVGLRQCLTRSDCLNFTFSYGWSRCIAGFFVGALLAEYRDSAPVASLAGRVPQALAFGIALLFFRFADRVPGLALAAPFVFATLVASLNRDSGPVARIFQTRAAQWLGRLSYSLYVAHAVFIPELANFATHTQRAPALAIVSALYLFASFALAFLLCERIETPCRQWFNALANRAFSGARRHTSFSSVHSASSYETPAS